jgi:two-component system response regulator DevR
VDADHRVRASLAGLLGLGDQLLVVGQASHVGEALQTCEATDPDVVVIDPRLPDVDGGLALITVLRRRRPDIRVLVLAWTASHEHQVLDSRADALLPKSLAPQELVERVVELAETPEGGCLNGDDDGDDPTRDRIHIRARRRANPRPARR